MTVESCLAAIQARKPRLPSPITQTDLTRIAKGAWRRHKERMREAGVQVPRQMMVRREVR